MDVPAALCNMGPVKPGNIADHFGNNEFMKNKVQGFKQYILNKSYLIRKGVSVEKVKPIY